jgi:hypothetical protein
LTWLMNQQSNGKALKDIFDSRIMAEKWESFARRNPGDVLTQSNVEVMLEISNQLLKNAEMEADVTRYEQAVPGSLSGNENATTYGDLDPTGDSLLSSLSKSILEMKNAMASFDLDNMMSAPVLTAMREEGLTGFEADVMETILKDINPILTGQVQRSGDNAKRAGYSTTASYVHQIASLAEESLKSMAATCMQGRMELDIEQVQKMTLTSTLYQYQKLSGDKAIRVLSIDHMIEGTIQCHLTEIDLDAPNVTYSALSYVWSDYRAPALGEYNPHRAKQEFAINCDGLELLVTLNLYQFLEQQSQQIDVSQKAYYWIDQVCINQQDLSEKATQVSMMDEIYKSATRVIAWLGPEDTFTAGAIRTIRYVASIFTDLGNGKSEQVASRLREEGPVSLKMWDDLGAIIDRVYFSRAWILQEMILAPRLQFYCGSYEISSDELEKCSMVITQAEPVRRFLESRGKRFGASSQNDDGTRFGQQVAMIFGIRTKYIDEPVDNLFFLGRCFNATNAHDHAYALLGLIKERLNREEGKTSLKLPTPDYGKLVKKTYLEFSKTFLNATGDLRLLSHIEDVSCRSIKSLPSWIPDLSVRLWPQPLWSASYPSGAWCAPGNLPFKSILVHDCVLTIHAACIGIIKEAAMPFGNTRVWIDVFRLLDGLHGSGCSETYIDHALVRTLVTDIHPAMNSTGEHKALEKDFRYWLIDELAHIGEGTGYLGINAKASERFREHIARMKSKLSTFREDLRNDRVAAVRAHIQDLPSMMRWPEGMFAPNEPYDTGRVEAERVYADFRTILSKIESRSNVLHTKWEFDLWLRVRKGPDSAEKAKMTEAADRFRSKIGLKTKHRRMMRTANGWLGMGPSSLQAGDKIFVVPGANAPLIMRRLDPGHYQVIGEAYIHGIMHGEAVTENVKTTEIHLGNDTDARVDAILLPKSENDTGTEGIA